MNELPKPVLINEADIIACEGRDPKIAAILARKRQKKISEAQESTPESSAGPLDTIWNAIKKIFSL